MHNTIEQPKFTAQIVSELQDKVVAFLNENADKIPKGVKVTFTLVGRYGANGFQADPQIKISHRKSQESEVLGSDITDEDWEYIFTPSNFQSPFIKDFEKVERFYDQLQKIRDRGNEPGSVSNSVMINAAFIRCDSPYRIVEKMEPYQHAKSWSGSRMETRFRRTRDYYLAKLW